MMKRKNGLSVQYRQPFLKVIGAAFLVGAISLSQVPVPTVQAADSDFRMDGNILIKYTGSSTNVTIPGSVEEIATEAFAENGKLTAVVIPKSVTKIDNSAFLNCTALKGLTIPDSVKEIGKSAFSGCSALSTLSIGSGLSKLEAGAFAGCTSLSTATIAKKNSSLSDSSINTGTASFTCKDGVIYGKNGTLLSQMLAGRKSDSYIMPSTVTNISEYAFWNCGNLKKVNLSSNLKEIPAYAFSNCNGLEKVDVPYSVKSIQMKAFENCKKLSEIEIPESVSFIHETAFDGCNLKNSLSSNSVSSDSVSENEVKGKEKQDNTTKSQEPQQPVDGMERTEDASVIGKTKIVGGQALVLINSKQANVISDGVSSNAIQKSKNGEDISEDGTKIVKEAYYQNDALKNYDFPDGIEQIEDFAFARSGLVSITIPDTVSKIGYAAFYHCDDLSDIIIPESVTQIEGEAFQKTAWMNQWSADATAEDYLVVGDGILIAYKGTQSKVVIPDSVKSIAADAFKNHTEITDVIFPETLTAIYDNAFAGCENLQSFSGGDNLTVITEHAFDGCPIEVTSTEVEPEAKNYIGTVGKYQVLVKGQEKNQIFHIVKWAAIMGLSLMGLILLTKAGINSRKKRI